MRTSIRLIASVISALAVFTLAGTMTVSPHETRAAGTRTGFGFNATLSGFGTASVRLTGGGSFDIGTPESGSSIASGGGFRCLEAVNQGPLTGCQAGEGVRWDTVELLPGITFKCSGDDTPHLASTSDDTVALIADFYRAGDGIDESFTSPMFVSATDQRPDLPGDQNVWIAGVGCGDGQAHFSG